MGVQVEGKAAKDLAMDPEKLNDLLERVGKLRLSVVGKGKLKGSGSRGRVSSGKRQAKGFGEGKSSRVQS
jgi:hypothetical protein